MQPGVSKSHFCLRVTWADQVMWRLPNRVRAVTCCDGPKKTTRFNGSKRWPKEEFERRSPPPGMSLSLPAWAAIRPIVWEARSPGPLPASRMSVGCV